MSALPLQARRPGPRRWRPRLARVVGVALLTFGPVPGAAADELARGDQAWARRAEGHRDGRPEPGPIRDAVAAYQRALDARPDALEPRWKLLRALHFAGDFAARNPAEALSWLDRARRVSEEGLDRLAQRVGASQRLDELDPAQVRRLLERHALEPGAVARLYFWSAIDWGAWAREVGLVGAVRRGVANRLHRYATLSLALDPDLDQGGALRLLGRLHAELPRVPFVSGWVDRDRALPLVERAYELAPEHPGNRLLLALTLLDLAPERREQALALLDQVESLSPRPSMQVEDLAMRRAARERLAAVQASST